MVMVVIVSLSFPIACVAEIGLADGIKVVVTVGEPVGTLVGILLGNSVGSCVGWDVGSFEGIKDGFFVGCVDGIFVGSSVIYSRNKPECGQSIPLLPQSA